MTDANNESLIHAQLEVVAATPPIPSLLFRTMPGCRLDVRFSEPLATSAKDLKRKSNPQECLAAMTFAHQHRHAPNVCTTDKGIRFAICRRTPQNFSLSLPVGQNK
jgi:hypothetical protein